MNNGGGGHCGGLDGIIKSLDLQNKVKKTNLSVFPTKSKKYQSTFVRIPF